MRRRNWRLLGVALLALSGAIPAVSYAQATSTFASAAAAFEQGNYREALGLFQQARAEGVDSPALHYNLGVCQYRVGDYAQAESTFRSLAVRFPELRALAEYNRGLALLALQRNGDAAAAFATARAAGDERLAALAVSALAELGTSAVPPTPTRSWLGYFDFALGHDDNVALVDESSLPATVSASSALHEVLGFASHRFALRVPLRLDLSGYLVRYPDATEFNQDAWRVDTAFEWSARAWRLAAGPHVAVTTLDGDGFERSVGAALRATRSLSSRWSFELQALYDDIDSPTARFDYVTGTRERLRFGLEHRTAGGRVRVGYELESQDRASPSISPERGRFAFSYARRVRERWSIEGAIARRSSCYDDLLAPRDEQLLEVTAAARRELPAGWLLNAEYRWADNDADVAQFGYRSRRVGLGVSRSF